MNQSIYEIEQKYLALSEELIACGGEVSEETAQQLTIIESEIQHKGIAYGYIIKQLEGEAEMIDIEIKRLSDLKKVRGNAVSRLKETLSNAMRMFGIEEIKTNMLKINFRKSETVEVEDINELDSRFIKTVVSLTPDKIAIKEAIKSGETVDGAFIQTNLNIQIK